jgi:signal transduction histidine kinase
LSLVSVGVALIVSLRLAPQGPVALPLLVFTVAMLASGAVGGRGPALAAVAMSALAGLYFFVPPLQQPKLPRSPDVLVALAAFTAAGSLAAWLAHRRSRTALEVARADAIAERLRNETSRRELLLELDQRALAGTSLEALCREVVAIATAALGVRYCAVLERMTEVSTLRIRAATGWDPGSLEDLELDAGVDAQAGYALYSRQPVVVEDVNAESRFAVPMELKAAGVRSGVCAGICGASRPFGVVAAYSDEARRYTREEVQFVKGVANILASAYERKLTQDERITLAARDDERRAAADAASRRTAFLAQTTTVLNAALDAEATLVSLARLAVPALADCAIVDAVEEDGRVRRVDVVDIDPVRRDTARALMRFAPNLSIEGPSARAIRTGQPVLMSDLPDSVLEATAPEPDHLRLVRHMQWRSLLLIPLVARGQTLGLITLGSRSEDRRYGSSDLAVAQELAGRAAVALDNARLYREAQSASRAKDQFLATVSHELRTPINAVLGWAAMLRTGKIEEGRARHAIEAIERSARAQAQLLEQLLDLSRIVAGKLEMHFAPARLASIIESSIDVVRPAADAKNVRILSHLDDAVPLLLADPDRLQQVLVNLLSNAVKFTPGDGRVEVELRRADPYAEIHVIDHGVGIKREFLPYVFERYRQADPSSGQLDRGLGLGLSIVRDIVELHGGSVTAESAGEGAGATFTVKLPLRSLSDAPGVNPGLSAIH